VLVASGAADRDERPPGIISPTTAPNITKAANDLDMASL
jgi:hypothetical protein